MPNVSGLTSMGQYLIAERSEATPGLFNAMFSTISTNIDQINADAGALSVAAAPGWGKGSITTLLDTSGGTLSVISVGATSPRDTIVFTSHLTIQGSLSASTLTVLGLAPRSGNTIAVIPTARFIVDSVQSGQGIFNVKAFGATGDGSTNDTNSIQTALNAAVAAGAGSIVFFPVGTYRITSASGLSINQPIVLQGASTEGSVLSFSMGSGNTGIIWINAANPIRVGFGARDLAFNGNGPGDGQSLFALTRCAGISFWNCSFGGPGGVQRSFTSLVDTWNTGFYQCFWSNCSRAYDTTNSVSGGEQDTFVHCTFAGNSSSGTNQIVLADNAADTHFIGCAFDTSQVSIAGGTSTFVASHFEDSNDGLWGGPLLTIGGARATIMGGVVYSHSSTTAAMFCGAGGDLALDGTYFQGSAPGPVVTSPAAVNISGGNVQYTHWMPGRIFRTSSLFTGVLTSTATMMMSSAMTLSATSGFQVGSALSVVNMLSAGSADISGNLRALMASFVAPPSGAAVEVNFRSGDSVGRITVYDRTAGSYTSLYLEGNPIGIYPNGTLAATYRSNPQTDFAGPVTVIAGSALAPQLVFASEMSLGWYRSIASTMALSYGTLYVPSNLSVNGPTNVGAMLRPTMAAFAAPNAGSGIEMTMRSGDSSAYISAYDRTAGSYVTLTVSGNPTVLQANGATVVTLRSQPQTDFAGPATFIAGSALAPQVVFTSEVSLGWYRSGVSTMALSYGTFNINQARTVSMRTLAASSLTVSAANTNTIANECGFTIGGASGASFFINSGGTTYIFNSALSAANA